MNLSTSFLRHVLRLKRRKWHQFSESLVFLLSSPEMLHLSHWEKYITLLQMDTFQYQHFICQQSVFLTLFLFPNSFFSAFLPSPAITFYTTLPNQWQSWWWSRRIFTVATLCLNLCPWTPEPWKCSSFLTSVIHRKISALIGAVTFNLMFWSIIDDAYFAFRNSCG